MNAICDSEEISEEFVLMNDDFFIIKKIDKIDNFYSGLLSEKIDKYTRITGSSMYIRKLIMTRTRLMEQGIDSPLDYELHVPMVMQKNKLKAIISKNPIPELLQYKQLLMLKKLMLVLTQQKFLIA